MAFLSYAKSENNHGNVVDLSQAPMMSQPKESGQLTLAFFSNSTQVLEKGEEVLKDQFNVP